MGKLIKNHWARLIIIVAAIYQIAASIEGFVWPKIFWDFSTSGLNPLVAPVPYLQICNLLLGLAVVAFEWPIWFVTGTVWHRNILPRVIIYPICSFAAVLMYQSTNPAIYYLIGTGLYAWGLACGETVSIESWNGPAVSQERQIENGQV